MSTDKLRVKIRPMAFLDLNAIFDIDQQVRASAKIGATYEGFTTKSIFGIGTGEGSESKPNILEVAKLIDLGFVAEVDDKVVGFVLGRQTFLAERGIQEGEVAIIAVHPDYQGKGIAGKLIDALSNLFRYRGVHRVRVGIDPRDKNLTAIFNQAGFTGRSLPQYIKAFDVCIIPYQGKEFLKNCFPTKVFEYLAAGKPVVSSFIPDLEEYNRVVRLSKNFEEFVSNMEIALEEGKKDDAIKTYVETAKGKTWDNRVQGTSRLIMSLLKQKGFAQDAY